MGPQARLIPFLCRLSIDSKIEQMARQSRNKARFLFCSFLIKGSYKNSRPVLGKIVRQLLTKEEMQQYVAIYFLKNKYIYK